MQLSTLTQLLLCSSLVLGVSKAHAATYKCEKEGRITFTEIPCSDGKSSEIKLNTNANAVAESEYQRALKNKKNDEAALKKIETTRDKDLANQAKESKTLAAKNEKKKAQCADLQLKLKWAQEDARNASIKNEEKAKTKVRRASEKADQACRN
jgi:hypothetical protein